MPDLVKKKRDSLLVRNMLCPLVAVFLKILFSMDANALYMRETSVSISVVMQRHKGKASLAHIFHT